MAYIDQRVPSIALEFLELAGIRLHGLDYDSTSPFTVLRRYISHFGVTPRHTAYLWLYCKERVLAVNEYCRKVHLLWLLNLLKTGDTEHEMASRWQVDEKTMRKWTTIFIDVISDLGVVRTLMAYWSLFL